MLVVEVAATDFFIGTEKRNTQQYYRYLFSKREFCTTHTSYVSK